VAPVTVLAGPVAPVAPVDPVVPVVPVDPITPVVLESPPPTHIHVSAKVDSSVFSLVDAAIIFTPEPPELLVFFACDKIV
jgi:hypothetical protein